MKRNKILVVASCLIGLLAASAYSSRIRHLRDEIAGLSEKVPVLTVTRNMKAGEYLAVRDLQESPVLKEQVSLRSISPEDIELISGRRLIHPVPDGDPILWTDFSEGPRLRRPSEGIPPGYRVMALPADEIHTLVHFLSPGDRVDVISSSFDGSGHRLHSRTIAEEVVVLAVGRRQEGYQEAGEDDVEYPLSISLAVEPETALAILNASQVGEVHFLAHGSSPFAMLSGPGTRSNTPGAPPEERP